MVNDLVYGKLSGKNRILIIKGVGPVEIKINLKLIYIIITFL